MPTRILLIVNRISVSLFIIVLLDYFFFKGYIRSLLPSNITQLTWYYVLFGLPHIIASFVSYGNKEYASYYKKEILKGLGITALILLLFTAFFPHLFIYFFIAYTVYHVAWQQLGLCRRYIQNKNVFRVWSISGVTAAILLALSVGGEALVRISEKYFTLLQGGGVSALLIFSIASFFVCKKNEYVLTSSLIIILASISILSGYYIIGILMLRFTHDVSAFTIYTTHDKKYQEKYHNNLLYSFFCVQPRLILFFLPFFAIVLSYFLQKYNNFIFLLVILVLSFMHYYLEGIAWKRGTPHRNTLGGT